MAVEGPHGRHRLCREPQFHRADVRVRDHGGRRQSPGPGGDGQHHPPGLASAAAAKAGRDLFRGADSDSAARLADHRARRDDPCGAAAARKPFPPPSAGAHVLRDTRRAVRQCVSRWRADAVRRPAGADGGRDLGLGSQLHAEQLRDPRGAGGADQCRRGHRAVHADLAQAAGARTVRR